MGSFLFRIAKAAGTQKVKVKATTRKTASGKTTTVRQHTATRKKAEPKAPSKPKPSAKPNAVNVEVPPPTTAWIAKSDIPKMEARIDKLNKRAKRIGTEPISLVFGETTKVPLATRTGERIWREKVEVTVTGPEPRFAGWQFVASIKAMDAGNLLLAIDKQTVPAKYRKASMLCDHCGTNRKRKATYVIRNVDTGEYKQVGKTCLKDFMGHGNPAQFAEHLSEVSELLQEIEAWPDDDSVWLEDPLPRSPYFATQRYLEFVAHDIAANGWVKRGDSGWNNDTSTADSALYVMFPGRGQDTVEPPPSAQKKAKAALAWIRKKPQKWANNDYLWNLWVACREDLITIKETGIVASLIPLYERETNQERQAKAAAEGKGSQHVGTVGERREFKLTITNIRPYEGNYGLVYITKLVDDDGNEFTWFASKEPGEEGKTYNITATIKKHDEFRGVPQTHITRGKVAPLRKSFLFRITKAAGTQKVKVKATTRKTASGKTTTVRQHTATRKRAEPFTKVRNTAGLTQRQMDRIHKLLEAGQAEITKDGAKYRVRVRPEGNVRYSKVGEYASLSEALKALAERMGVTTSKTAEKTYKDVGEKIGGARKDIARAKDRFIENPTPKSLEQLEKEDPDAAARSVTKANLWPAPDTDELRAKGRSDQWIAVAKVLQSLVPPKPPKPGADGRRAYLHTIAHLQESLEHAASQEDLAGLLQELGRDVTAGTKHLRYEDLVASGRMASAEFVGRSNATECQVKLTEDLSGCDRLLKWLIRGAKVHGVSHSGAVWRVLAPAGTVQEESFRSWFSAMEGAGQAKARKAARPQTEDEAILKWERTVPSKYQRKGGSPIRIRRPDEYIKTFGLRGVEFGNWMDHDASRVHVDRCAEALSDLAEVLGARTQDVSLNGRLALAFGARGSGKAAAHYEPGKVVINLTKMGGAGTVAHEWGHFFDHVLGMLYADGEYLSTAIAKRKSTRPADTDDEVVMAFIAVHLAIYSPRVPTMIQGRPERAATKWDAVDDALRAANSDPQAALDWLAKHYRLSGKTRQLAVDYLCSKTGAKQLSAITMQSDFVDDAKRRGAYWKRPQELFARAFERYVDDKLASMGRANNYLVHGLPGDEAGLPYPIGEQRKAVYAAFDNLIATMHAYDTLRKAVSALQKASTQKVNVKGSTQRTRTGVRVQPAYQAKRSKATAKVTTPKGNVQYVYDEDTLAAAKAEKFRRVAHLAEQLPEIIGAVQEQMTQPDTPLGKVVAAVVALIDRCQFRIGTDEYAEKHGTYGVTTLRPEHVTVEGDTVHFRFTGKKQVPWDKATTDPDLAEFIDHLSEEGPGDRLFWYHAPSGEQRPIRASHVNAWLREYGVSAKDFRTYHATRLCYEELKRASSRKPLTKKEIKARVKAAVEATAERLGHTPAVCRQSYILPAVIEDFEANGGKLSINPWKVAKRMGKSFLFTRWA